MTLTVRDATLAALAAFVSWGFLTAWVPVLRALGYAFVGGAAAACAALLAAALLSARPGRRRWAGPRVPARTVWFLEPASWDEETEWLANMSETRRASVFPASAAVSGEADEVLDWLLRDFVQSWYGAIGAQPAFRNRIDAALRQAINVLRARVESQDFVEAAVSRVAPLVTAHLRDFYDAEHAVRGKKLNRAVTESEELDLAIAAKYRGGRLHPVASLAFSDTRMQQQEYLRGLCARLVPRLVSETLLQSRAAAVLVREVVACAVLSPALALLADPDTWNRVVEAYGRSTLEDRKSVRKLRAALDEHASPAPKPPKGSTFPKLSPRDDDRKFERFIRAIRQCNSLSDARRFRSEVTLQLRRESMVEGQDKTYLKRLETGKRILDQRVGMLSAVGGSHSRSGSDARPGHSQSRLANASIKEILHDTSGLSYFMEYMDRQRLMSLVQFWVVVDGFRSPLEDDVTEENDSLGVPLEWSESERQDIAQISETYLSKPEIKVPAEAQRKVHDFLKAGPSATLAQYSGARSVILKAQTAVMEVLQERHFQNFRKSDIFYKLLSSDDGAGKAAAKPSSLAKSARNQSMASIHEAPTPHAIAVQRRRSEDVDTSKLKRNAMSAGNLMGNADDDDGFLAPRPRASLDVDNSSTGRRSMDVDTSGPLFPDELETDSNPQPQFGTDSEITDEGASQAQIEAMEVALNDIVSSDHKDNDLHDSTIEPSEPASLFPKEVDKERVSGEFLRIDAAPSAAKLTDRPNLSSLGLVNTSSRIGVFRDNDLFGDEEKFPEDERQDSDEDKEDRAEEQIHEAAPGDLGLAEAISGLTVDIDKLAGQDQIIDALRRKAELTNNVAELRILGKSRTSIQKELRRKELQRQQYMVQESDNSLYGRATVEIKNIMVGREDDGQEFALYVTEVQRKAGEHMAAAAWAVARRYSEFHDLHQRLRALYPAVRGLEFPGRRLVMKLQREFVHKRRVALEHYLRELLLLPAVCRSRELRAFLSQRPISSGRHASADGDRSDLVSRIYNSVTDGMDEFLGNIPVLDQLSVAGQNLISAATSQYFSNVAAAQQGGSGGADGGAVALAHAAAASHAGPAAAPPSAPGAATAGEDAALAELAAFDAGAAGPAAAEPFVKPISDLFLEAFELNRSQNWLRGRAVVVVLHQLLGGAVERKVREVAAQLVGEAGLRRYLAAAKAAMWPGGKLDRDRRPRTPQERSLSRREAGALLATLMPELVGNVVGRANAQAAGRRFFAAMNNERLNTHLVFEMLDEVVAILFPE